MSLPIVEITYCRQYRWSLRAAWLAQELLTTFEEEIGSVSLSPGTGGAFRIVAAGKLVWDRKEEGRFPEAAELKQRVRDIVSPGRARPQRYEGSRADPGSLACRRGEERQLSSGLAGGCDRIA